MNATSLAIETFLDNSFGENAYVLSTVDDTEDGGDKGGRDTRPPGGRASRPPGVGWIIDPSFPPQVQELLKYVAAQHIRVERVILTHGHLDHIAGVDLVHQAHPKARVALAQAEQGALADAEENLSESMGMPVVLQTRADEDLLPGAELRLGALTWRILDVSGHSPAGRALYCPQAGAVFTGDALFAGSIGRTDFPGSDGRQLLHNIRRNLYTLPDETVVYSGHGPTTIIGNERKFNPFVSDPR